MGTNTYQWGGKGNDIKSSWVYLSTMIAATSENAKAKGEDGIRAWGGRISTFDAMLLPTFRTLLTVVARRESIVRRVSTIEKSPKSNEELFNAYLEWFNFLCERLAAQDLYPQRYKSEELSEESMGFTDESNT